MVANLLADALGVIILVAFALYFINYSWFDTFSELVGRLAWIPVQITVGLLKLVVLLSSMFVQAGAKAVASCILGLLTTFAIVTTIPASFTGNRVLKAIDRSSNYLLVLGVQESVRKIRSDLIGIVVEHDDQEPKFNSISKYRNEIVDVRDAAATKLEKGETFLTLFLGGAVTTAQLAGAEVFERTVLGISGSLWINIYLLILAGSVLYRATVLGFLGFDGNEDFSSIEEWDVALSYQRAISLTNFIEAFTFQFFIASVLTGKFGKAKPIIEAQYAEDMTNWEMVRYLWNEFRKGNL